MGQNFKIVTLALILALSASCKSPQVVTERFYHDTTIIKQIPRIITLPSTSIQSQTVNMDSLIQLIKAEIPIQTINNTLYRTDPETGLRIGLLLDELGNITALCEQQERTIEILEKEIHRLTTSVETNTVIHQPSIFQSLKNWILGAVVIVAIFGLIRFISGLKVF
jgi:hypothetical protein